MDLKITGNVRNELLKRHEITAEVTFEKNPTREEVRNKIAALVHVPQEQIVIQRIGKKFGSTKAVITAKAFDSVEALKKTARAHLKKRNFKAEKTAEQKAADEAAANAPASFKK